MTTGNYHVPVLPHASIEGLGVANRLQGTFVDVTFGGGGHSRLILHTLGDHGRLFGFDQDPDANDNIPGDSRFQLIPENFRHTRNFLRLQGVHKIDGLLADLGVSSHQFDEGERGFSIRFDGPLDMRMNQSMKQSAADVIAEYEVDALIRVFREYGELKRPDKAAYAIQQVRNQQRIKSTFELMRALQPLAPRGRENQYFAQVFQALRIEVNDELGALKALLESTIHMMDEGARLVVISYHSLEDRLVKHFMRSGNFEDDVQRDFKGQSICPFVPITRKAIVASDAEQATNPRSRSARLRVAERTRIPSDDLKPKAA